jgi:glyoxylase-like metal-dependent hydrolase (beta-lactamase superfamily II)
VLKIGDFEVFLINDARILADAGGVFGLVPRVLWSRVISDDGQFRVPMDHPCLLVRTGDKCIVVDTGIGPKVTGKQIDYLNLTRPEGGLVEGLARLGVSPEDIDTVINTHLHSDHCGGNTRLDSDRLIPTFPNAEYLAQRLEYTDAAFPNERTRGTYFPENFAALHESGQMRLLDGEDEIVPGLRCVPTPGHTRGHQSVVIEQDGAALLYTGDLASLAIHFERLAWMTAYDVEPLVTLETKRFWQRWALAHDAYLIFAHDSQVPIGRLVEEQDGKHRIVPVDGPSG